MQAALSLVAFAGRDLAADTPQDGAPWRASLAQGRAAGIMLREIRTEARSGRVPQTAGRSDLRLGTGPTHRPGSSAGCLSGRAVDSEGVGGCRGRRAHRHLGRIAWAHARLLWGFHLQRMQREVAQAKAAGR